MESARALAAAGDTAAAGSVCLELDAFRSEAAEYRVVPAADESFDRDAARIRHAAAGRLVRSAEEAMADGRARNAYDQLDLARTLEAGYPGLDERQREAYAEALHRIAILPVSNQTEARGLGMEVTDLVYREAADRVRRRDFPFTVILPRSEVFSRITLAEANDLDRSDALEIARAVDADLVVRGRVYALSTESRRDTWEGSIFRRVAFRDSSGRSEERYDEIPIEVTGMTRRVTLRFEFEIRETDGGTTVVSHDEPLSAGARVTYTSYRPEGDCDDYVLASPALKRANSASASSRERAWKEHCGSWELPAYLETVQKGSRRAYESSMRSEFHGDTESRPVILGELPPAEELAAVAVRHSWEPLVEALRRLER
ncbi:MAG TPA: hypothetical protein VLT84_09685 [Acidobacteriota bacterium]|nr:hypothetical protein [Acidobacteriota bacterium]